MQYCSSSPKTRSAWRPAWRCGCKTHLSIRPPDGAMVPRRLRGRRVIRRDSDLFTMFAVSGSHREHIIAETCTAVERGYCSLRAVCAIALHPPAPVPLRDNPPPVVRRVWAPARARHYPLSGLRPDSRNAHVESLFEMPSSLRVPSRHHRRRHRRRRSSSSSTCMAGDTARSGRCRASTLTSRSPGWHLQQPPSSTFESVRKLSSAEDKCHALRWQAVGASCGRNGKLRCS